MDLNAQLPGHTYGSECTTHPTKSGSRHNTEHDAVGLLYHVNSEPHFLLSPRHCLILGRMPCRHAHFRSITVQVYDRCLQLPRKELEADDGSHAAQFSNGQTI